MNPSFSDIITVFSIILGVTGVLALAVSYLFWKKLQDIEESIQEINKQHRQLYDRVVNVAKELDDKIDIETKSRMEKHEELAKRVFTDVARAKEDIYDLSATVSGFSGSYVTRSEFIQHSQENIGFLEKLATMKNQKS